MPIVEVIYVSERELASSQIAAFTKRVRGILAATLQSQPEQVRVLAQRSSAAEVPAGAKEELGT